MEITKREVIMSVAIIAIMITIGFFLGEKMQDYQNDQNAKYRKAIQISDTEMFRYGIETSAGNAFVYGKLKAVDTVSYPEIEGEYIYLEKVKEKHTMHTRTVSHTRIVNGKTQTYNTTETYWTWDYAGSEELKAKEVEFCGVTFPISKISIPGAEYIDTINESSDIRYEYYGTGTEHEGTIFTDLRNGTISEDSKFYKDSTIKEALKSCTSNVGIVIFWIMWIMLTCLIVYGFYYLDNRWLE